jgi:hypothetical protein
MATSHDSSDSDEGSSAEKTPPQHLRIEKDEEERPVDLMKNRRVSLSLEDIQAMDPRSNRPPRRPRRSHEKAAEEEGFLNDGVSIGEVKKELSQLRVSARKYFIVNGGRRLVDSTEELSASLPEKDADPENNTDFPSPMETEMFFKDARKRIRQLRVALDKQQVVLFARHADILELRMSIVKAMMEFESESKLIKDDHARLKGHADMGERLNASWPMMPNNDGSVNGESSLSSSWPLLNFKRDSRKESEARLSLPLDIHTIVEELTGDLSEETATAPKENSDDDSSDSRIPGEQYVPNKSGETAAAPKENSGEDSSDSRILSAKEFVPKNIEPSSSFEMEPGNGRLPFPSKFRTAKLGTVEEPPPADGKSKVNLDDLKAPQTSTETTKASSFLEQALHCVQNG